MIALLVEATTDVAAALRTVRARHQDGDIQIIVLGHTPPDGAASGSYRYLSSYSTLNFTERLDKARRFSREWYRNGDTDYSRFQALSTGAVAEIDFFLFFIRLVEECDMFAGLLSRSEVSRLYLATANGAYLKNLISVLSPTMPVDILLSTAARRRRMSPGALQAWLKRRCLDRRVAFEVNRALTAIHPTLRSRPAPAGASIILFEMVVPSSYDTLLAVYQRVAGPGVAVMATDPRAAIRLIRTGLRPVMLAEGDNASAREQERQAHQEFKQAWHRLALHPPHLPLHGVNLWPLVEPKARDFFRFQAALIIREAECLRRLARMHHWHTTCSSSHLHHFGRLCTILSAEGGPASVTIQHGVVGVHTYLPMLASKIAVWGDLVRDWFIERGVAPQQIVITGQPRFQRADPATSATITTPELPFTVLIATQPLGASFQQALAQAVLQAAAELPNVRFVIRPHPDEPSEWYTSLVAAAQAQNIVLERGDLAAALRRAAVVVVHSSTVGLEGLLLQKPLLVFNPFAWPEEVPYVSAGAAQDVRSGAALTAQIALLYNDSQAYRHAVQQADRFVQGYICFDAEQSESLETLLGLREQNPV